MLTKLIKHEFRATAHTFLPLFGGAMILSGLTWIVTRLGGILILSDGTGIFSIVPIGSPVFGLFSGILMLLTILALFALMVSVMLVTIQRFYKNLLGDEGYLMFTLPVTPGQHIAAKLLAGTVWTAAALLLASCVILALVLAIPGAADYGLTLPRILALFQRDMGIPFGVVFAIFFPCFLIGVSNAYLLTYLSMALGSQRQEKRLAASFAAYVALNAVLMVLYLLGVFLLASVATALGYAQALQNFLDSLPPVAAFGLIDGISACVMLIGDVIYFLVTRGILTKRLNLA